MQLEAHESPQQHGLFILPHLKKFDLQSYRTEV